MLVNREPHLEFFWNIYVAPFLDNVLFTEIINSFSYSLKHGESSKSTGIRAAIRLGVSSAKPSFNNSHRLATTQLLESSSSRFERWHWLKYNTQQWHSFEFHCSTKKRATSVAGSVGDETIKNPVLESLKTLLKLISFLKPSYNSLKC